MTRLITENEFKTALIAVLSCYKPPHFDAVTGAGRSGAIASVYASHALGARFVAYGDIVKPHEKLLIIDTAKMTGKTMRKAAKKYSHVNELVTLTVYDSPIRHKFWYEFLAKEMRND